MNPYYVLYCTQMHPAGKNGTPSKNGMASSAPLLQVWQRSCCVAHTLAAHLADHCNRARSSDFSAFLIALSLRFSSSRLRMSFSSCFTPESYETCQLQATGSTQVPTQHCR